MNAHAVPCCGTARDPLGPWSRRVRDGGHPQRGAQRGALFPSTRSRLESRAADGLLLGAAWRCSGTPSAKSHRGPVAASEHAGSLPVPGAVGWPSAEEGALREHADPAAHASMCLKPIARALKA
eukprot:CAMPEP_0115876176 /NCGR_PEP_ID=MMETSP0287-20121206/25511_1 /TAXON_ID=412157 /ORGANISM="Chrysochromulina rotalis, Strain UIO044" /LENGTH=123 /DNA_ID=CAMNT_0003331529 /DNA_START=238 /DNA_END=609 /DNA_ORIENTATION=+